MQEYWLFEVSAEYLTCKVNENNSVMDIFFHLDEFYTMYVWLRSCLFVTWGVANTKLNWLLKLFVENCWRVEGDIYWLNSKFGSNQSRI